MDKGGWDGGNKHSYGNEHYVKKSIDEMGGSKWCVKLTRTQKFELKN